MGQVWIWDLVPKHLSPMTLLLSLPISSPDEPLKWQYVDQFVSESEVRVRTTSDGVRMEWSSRRGSRSEGGLALGMWPQGLHPGP